MHNVLKFGKYDKVIGVDHGNGFFKVVINKNKYVKTYIIPSILTNYEDVRSFEDSDIGNHNQKTCYESLKFKGEEYAIGDDALAKSNTQSTIASKNRYSQKPYRLLSEFFLANFLDDGDNVLIITGTPSLERKTDGIEDRIKEVFQGKHEVKINGKLKTFTVECKVKSQPLGTLFSERLDDNGNVARTDIIQKYVGIIDAGTQTLDTAGIDGRYGKASSVEADYVSIDRGMNHIYTKVATWIEQEASKKGGGYNVNPYEIEHHVRKQQFNFMCGQIEINFKERFVQELNNVVAYIAKELDSKLTNLKMFNEIMLTGGGASIPLFVSTLEEKLGIKITELKEPVYANARGFYRFGVAQALKGKL